MRILVLEVASGQNSCLVRFSSSSGHAFGDWVGETPAVGEFHDVEIDFPALDSPEVAIGTFSDDSFRPALREANGWVVLNGVYRPGPGRGAGAIRVDEFLLLVSGAPSDWTAGTRVRIEARNIWLYPYLV